MKYLNATNFHRQLFIVSLMASAYVAVAEEVPKVVEVWECFSRFDENIVLFKLTRYKELFGEVQVGEVQVAGVTSYAKFAVEGLNRRWDWEQDDSGYRYAIVMGPDGSAWYYDFDLVNEDGRAKRRQIFQCKKL